MPIVYVEPSDRRGSFLDIDGKLAFYKDEDAITTYTLNYVDDLPAGETISASTWTADGVTVNSSSNTTTTTTVTIAKSGGEVKNTVTTSGGSKLIKRIRLVDYDR